MPTDGTDVKVYTVGPGMCILFYNSIETCFHKYLEHAYSLHSSLKFKMSCGIK